MAAERPGAADGEGDMTDGPAAPAGWYPQPDGSKRFWDGQAWADPSEPAAAPVKKGLPGWVWVVGVLVLVGGCTALNSNKGGSGSDYDEYGAWANCQELQDKQLKAPATAGYPTLSELTWSKSGSTWTFTRAWVDAENSFGAKIREYFDCTVTDTGGGKVNVRVTPAS